MDFYPYKEERINIVSHAIGLGLSLIGWIILLHQSISSKNGLAVVSFFVYGLSLVVLFAASTFYHRSKNLEQRQKLKILDHAAIYFLIAGTYTPFCLLVLKDTVGWIIFGLTWFIAIVGIILKLFFTGRFIKISTASYILMGWLIIFAIGPLIENLPTAGLFWLFLGGVFFTLGAIIYMFKKITYTHAIFHILVLLACMCHYIAVYLYVLPFI